MTGPKLTFSFVFPSHEEFNITKKSPEIETLMRDISISHKFPRIEYQIRQRHDILDIDLDGDNYCGLDHNQWDIKIANMHFNIFEELCNKLNCIVGSACIEYGFLDKEALKTGYDEILFRNFFVSEKYFSAQLIEAINKVTDCFYSKKLNNGYMNFSSALFTGDKNVRLDLASAISLYVNALIANNID